MSESLDIALSAKTYEIGQHICAQSTVDCIDYHYLRPIMRRLGAATTPFSHEDFYHQAIDEALDGQCEQLILISGSADYCWLLDDSPLLRSVAGVSKKPSIAMLDICPTPLAFSHLAHQSSLYDYDFSTTQVNLLDRLPELEAPSIIITDAFLTQFPAAEHRRLILDRWYTILDVGGIAITTAQVRSPQSVNPDHFLAHVAERYADSIYPDLLEVNKEAFLERIKRCSSSLRSRLYESELEMLTDIKETDFEITDIVNLPLSSIVKGVQQTYKGIILTKSK